MRTALIELVTPVFREIFANDALVLTEQTGPSSVDGWDSFGQFQLIVRMEEQFGVTFETTEIEQIRCVADVLNLLESKGVKA